MLGHDDYELPRVLLEYAVCGGKFTAAVNGMENMRARIQDERGEEADDQSENYAIIRKKNKKKKRARNENKELNEDIPRLPDFTATVEFIETRA